MIHNPKVLYFQVPRRRCKKIPRKKCTQIPRSKNIIQEYDYCAQVCSPKKLNNPKSCGDRSWPDYCRCHILTLEKWPFYSKVTKPRLFISPVVWRHQIKWYRHEFLFNHFPLSMVKITGWCWVMWEFLLTHSVWKKNALCLLMSQRKFAGPTTSQNARPN